MHNFELLEVITYDNLEDLQKSYKPEVEREIQSRYPNIKLSLQWVSNASKKIYCLNIFKSNI